VAATNDDLAIRAEGLRKVYGANVAVEDLHLAVERGEVFGFLGPNGAGKTTSLKMFLGLARPTAGAAWILGHDPSDWRIRKRVGFLPEHFRFQEWLRATEFLEVHAHLYGMEAPAIRERVPKLLEMVGLTRHAEKPLRDFSKGMLQRVGLAQAMLNSPDLVFLDEPTSGLDPLGRRLVRDVIHELRDQGISVFLNSHLLSEVEITCDRVAFIRRGRVVQAGRLEELLAEGTEVELRLGAAPPDLLEGLRQFGPCEVDSVGLAALSPARDGAGVTVILRLASEHAVPHAVAWLAGQGAEIYGVLPRRLSLEEVFLRVMEGEEAG
jgi:ABC-2 type transport system ATP-binding protein